LITFFCFSFLSIPQIKPAVRQLSGVPKYSVSLRICLLIIEMRIFTDD